jgi:hypothetical protein
MVSGRHWAIKRVRTRFRDHVAELLTQERG